MTITLYAQPYDISADGFYFKTAEEYYNSVKTLRNRYGEPVEEFEMQFIDGEAIDCELARAISLNQASFARFFEMAEEWEDHEKTRFIIVPPAIS